MISKVEGELFGDLFPERVKLWEHLKRYDKVQSVINYATDRYLDLYDTCSSSTDSDAELFLRWLDVMRSFTCKECQTEETRS